MDGGDCVAVWSCNHRARRAWLAWWFGLQLGSHWSAYALAVPGVPAEPIDRAIVNPYTFRLSMSSGARARHPRNEVHKFCANSTHNKSTPTLTAAAWGGGA